MSEQGRLPNTRYKRKSVPRVKQALEGAGQPVLDARHWIASSISAISARLGLATPADMREIREEQGKALRTSAFMFAGIGINSACLVMADFWDQADEWAWILAASIVFAYGTWVAVAWRSRGTTGFISMSVGLLALQGLLWGLLIFHIGAVAMPVQKNFLTALIITMVSTPMLGSPFSIAMAFWAPTAILGFATLAIEMTPGEGYMLTCFAGYLVFTLVCALVLNRTLLDRSIIRTNLQRQNGTVRLLLRDYEENAADWLWETDPGMRLRAVTPRFAEVLQRDQAAVEGSMLHDIMGLTSPRDPEAGMMAEAIEKRTSFRDLAVRVSVGGDTRWWSITGHPVEDTAKGFLGYRGVASDVTATKRSDEVVRHLASHDSLTGLENRRAFLERLDRACGEERVETRDGGRRSFALLMMDLDRFKEVNDDYGHASGDCILMAVAERTKAIVREGDCVARLGGDEFAILLASATEEASSIAKRLIEAVSERVRVGNTWLGVGASIGVAIYPRDAENPNDIMRAADLALYRAKERSRGTHEVFDPKLESEYLDRVALLADLKTAVEEGNLKVHYQPIVDLATGRVVSMEALSRWTHPTRGTVPPSTFIPMAEENGLIGRMSRTTLNEACSAAMGWENGASVSVNLSPLQLKDRQLLGIVAEALGNSGLPPSRLDLEITESAWPAASEEMERQLAGLEAMGIKIVMDDFGTGFSTLSSLRTSRFGGLKIDASFTRDLEHDAKSQSIVKFAAFLAADLGIMLTAEGIETEGQLSLARSYGIPRGQGYLLGQPMAAA